MQDYQTISQNLIKSLSLRYEPAGIILYKETEELYTSTTLSPQLCELRNLITIAYLVTSGAQMRKESRGLHFNTDYPDKYGYNETTYM